MDGLWFLWVDIKLLWNLTTWQWILMILKTTDGIRRLYDGISFISEWSEPWDFLQKSCWYEALQMKSFVVVFCNFYNWKLEQGSSNFVATYTTSSNLGRLNSSWMAKSTQNYSNVISLFLWNIFQDQMQNHNALMTKIARMDGNIYGLWGWIAVQIPQLTAISETYLLVSCLLNSHYIFRPFWSWLLS